MEPIDQLEVRQRLEAAPAGRGRRGPDLHLFEVDARVDTALVRELEIFHRPGLFLNRDGHLRRALHARRTPGAVEQTARRVLLRPAAEAL